MYADNLPLGSATRRAIGANDSWSNEAHLLAEVTDALAAGNWQRGGGTGPKPTPVARPIDDLRAAERAERNVLKAAAWRRRQQFARTREES